MKNIDLKDTQKKSPFIFFIPDKLDIYDISYREEGNKWATLRYFVDYSSYKLRIKEFFLDWFFTSFPKNLMASFVDSYSRINIFQGRYGNIFTGKDYKNMNASSYYAMGTQIEIEGAHDPILKEINNILRPLDSVENFRSIPFHRRSFFARNKNTSWFEEERIARMKWDIPSQHFSIDDIHSSSLGLFLKENVTIESLLILSDDNFQKVIWIDISRIDYNIPHLYYTLRRGGTLYNYESYNNGLLCYITNSGPGLWQIVNNDFAVTVSFSTNIFLQNFKDNFKDVETIIKSLMTKYF